MTIDHLGLRVPAESFQAVLEFYKTVLTPLGYKEMMRPMDTVVGLGVTMPDFWILGRAEEQPSTVGRIHLAFSAAGT